MKLLITKAAALVLLWTLCLSTALWSVNELVVPLSSGLIKTKKDGNITFTLLVELPAVLLVLVAFPLSGWLADSRFGNLKVFRAGCVLMFLASVLLCMCTLVEENVDLFHYQALFISVVVAMPLSLFASFAGGSACLVTVFQLGLDQTPDASSAGITSYILLFWTATSLGIGISSSYFMVIANCIEYRLSVQGLSLIPVLCTCIILSSLFLFNKIQKH